LSETILYHRTGFIEAISILWNREIWGGGGGGVHENFPHFYIKGEHQDIQQAKRNDIILEFICMLPVEECPTNIPAYKVINRHVDTYSRFWQATIAPGSQVKYVGYKFVSNERKSSIHEYFLRILDEHARENKVLTTSIDQRVRKPPNLLRLAIFTLTKMGRPAELTIQKIT